MLIIKYFAKVLNEFLTYPNNNNNYLNACFDYIHQNPIKEGFFAKIEDCEFSSFSVYSGLRNGNLCNKLLASDIFGIDLKIIPVIAIK